jgi:hypothetical protein
MAIAPRIAGVTGAHIFAQSPASIGCGDATGGPTMKAGQPDPPMWEPTAGIVISGVAALAGAIGLLLAASLLNGPRQGGMERLGEFVLLMGTMGGTLVVTGVGMLAAGIGSIRSNRRGIRTPSLLVTFIANLAEFCLVFLLPMIMGRI